MLMLCFITENCHLKYGSYNCNITLKLKNQNKSYSEADIFDTSGGCFIRSF